MIVYLSKTQWFHWHFSHQTEPNRHCSIHVSAFFYSAFFLMSMKVRIVSTKNSHLLINTVTWLWVKTFPVEYSKPVSVLYSIIVFWFLRFHKQKKNCSIWKGPWSTPRMQEIRALLLQLPTHVFELARKLTKLCVLQKVKWICVPGKIHTKSSWY